MNLTIFAQNSTTVVGFSFIFCNKKANECVIGWIVLDHVSSLQVHWFRQQMQCIHECIGWQRIYDTISIEWNQWVCILHLNTIRACRASFFILSRIDENKAMDDDLWNPINTLFWRLANAQFIGNDWLKITIFRFKCVRLSILIEMSLQKLGKDNFSR